MRIIVKIEQNLLFIYFDDLKKKSRKMVEKYLKDNEVIDKELIEENVEPVIIIGFTPDEEEDKDINRMVS